MKSTLLVLAVLLAIGVSTAADKYVEGTVPAITTFVPPNGGAVTPLDPRYSPVTLADSFKVECNGPFEVTATALPASTLLGVPVIAANGKMVEWDTLLGAKYDGHILDTPMHLIGNAIGGDLNMQAISLTLVDSNGVAETTYPFDWSQGVTWADYPETPYRLDVRFELNRVIT